MTRSPYAVVVVGLLLTGMASTIAFAALTSLLMGSVDPPERRAAIGGRARLGTQHHGPRRRMPIAFVILLVVALLAVEVAIAGSRANTR